MGRDKLPPHVRAVQSKGRTYYYYQRGRGTAQAEKQIRLPDAGPSSPEFWQVYAELSGRQIPRVNPNAVGQVIDAWHKSPEWRKNAEKTRYEWSRYCDRIRTQWGDLDIAGIQPKHVLALRDRYASTPAAANNMLTCLSSLMAWSVPRGHRPDNPCREIKSLPGGDGYAPWPWEVIEQTRDMRAELWWFVALALYTGQRRGDVLEMRWDAIRNGMLHVVPEKTKRHGTKLWIPIHRDLRPVLDTIPRRAVTILTNSEGRPWTGDGFSASWRKAAPAVLKQHRFVLHGLRKSAVCMLLEAGCSDAEVAAITGQSREIIAHYARQVNQKRLAARAILRWEQDGLSNALSNRDV